MKKSKLIYTVIAAALLAGAIGASAQSDSSNVPQLRGNPVVSLTLQERETPVINHVYPITRVAPSTTIRNGSASGVTTAQAWANCNAGETVLGGGGSCNDNSGLVAVAGSSPSGSSWVIGCQSLNYRTVYATAYAVCSAN